MIRQPPIRVLNLNHRCDPSMHRLSYSATLDGAKLTECWSCLNCATILERIVDLNDQG